VKNSIGLQKWDYLRQVKNLKLSEIAEKLQRQRMLLWYTTMSKALSIVRRILTNSALVSCRRLDRLKANISARKI
jgi:hypothetical protein